MYTERLKSHHASQVYLKNAFVDSQSQIGYVKNLLQTEAHRPRSVYIHVPYCSNLCSFCNLNRTMINASAADYHKLIIKQIKAIADYPYIQSKEFDSIYFGGGTPTVLSAKQWELILDTMHNLLPISKTAEISVETSITELTEARLEILKRMGVNRLSIGVQTFVDRGRRLLKRRGSGEDTIAKINKVLDMGFKNTNIDLIYNYSNQTMQELEFDLETIKKLDIAGLSYYSLILHEGSLLSKLIENGKVENLPDISAEKVMFGKVYNELLSNGFELLELTKIVRKNRDEYKYIQVKNRAGDCLALGNGAGGRLGNYLYYNGPMMSKVPKMLLPISPMGKIVTEYYNIVTKIIGQIQFGFISFNQSDDKTNEKIFKHCSTYIEQLLENKLIVEEGEKYRLTKEGIFWGNNICSDVTKLLVGFFNENEETIKNNEVG
ncbi:MAG: coproporphyrinogen-III oxidase family protein [Alkaliphilus sp.]